MQTIRVSSLLLSLLALAPGALGQVSSCDQCKFAGSDAANCKVYGQLGDDVLIPWALAPQACLDAFNIKDQVVNPQTLADMFPNADGTGGTISSVVNFLRFNSGAVVMGLRASLPDFFVESTRTPGSVVFKDTITVDGTSYNCANSESSCWTAMRAYFATSKGAAEMANIGCNLYNTQANSREKEQSFARIRLCSDGAEAACGDLSTQVQDVKVANPNKFCSAFGLGPAQNTIPGCTTGALGSSCSGAGSGGSGSPSGTPNASAALRPVGLLALVGAALAVAAAF
mmetsp:Transcript_8530/g.21319  ORF Transcript_8530/g.21319 Transcript_8530/m.21319 type:complete len:285 (-) Transcript_8530:139-993(-)